VGSAGFRLTVTYHRAVGELEPDEPAPDMAGHARFNHLRLAARVEISDPSRRIAAGP